MYTQLVYRSSCMSGSNMPRNHRQVGQRVMRGERAGGRAGGSERVTSLCLPRPLKVSGSSRLLSSRPFGSGPSLRHGRHVRGTCGGAEPWTPRPCARPVGDTRVLACCVIHKNRSKLCHIHLLLSCSCSDTRTMKSNLFLCCQSIHPPSRPPLPSTTTPPPLYLYPIRSEVFSGLLIPPLSLQL